MNAQMKRGFLEACVLATLCRRESYGYQIIKDVPASLGLSESSLYPLLKRLQGSGLIAVRTAEHNGRLRKYYRITEDGQERLRAFLTEQDEVRGLYRYVEESMAASPQPAFGDAPTSAREPASARPSVSPPSADPPAGETPPGMVGGAPAWA